MVSLSQGDAELESGEPDRAGRFGVPGWVWIAAAVALFALVTVATFVVAYPRMFGGFAPYDDEGYLLLSLRSFIDHVPLYEDIYTPYGPFFHELWGVVFSLPGIELTHHAGRIATLAAWTGSALVIGLAVWRITGNVLAGVIAQLLAFGGLPTLVNEPMHPAGLICLLLAAILAIAAFVGPRPAPRMMVALGAVVAALILTKVNVGAFALIAVVVAGAVSYAVIAGRRWLRLVIEAGFVALPIVLIHSHLGDAWGRRYALHVAAAALAVVIVMRTLASDPDRRPFELVRFAAGLAGTTLVVCLIAIVGGTGPFELIDGMLIGPISQPDTFTLPLLLTDRMLWIDLLAIGGAIFYWYVARSRPAGDDRPWLLLTSIVGLLVGVSMGLSVIGQALPLNPAVAATANELRGFQFGLLAFAWVALIPPPGTLRASGSATRFARVLLPPLAVLQALHAYPVAGSQIEWSTFLLAPVAVVCIANGFQGIVAAFDDRAARRALTAFGVVAAALLSWVVVNETLRKPHDANQLGYDSAIPVDLPGSADIRVGPEQAVFPAMVAAINQSCEAFVTYPGLDSFYMWTGQDPPGDKVTGSAWMAGVDAEKQQEIVDTVSGIDRLCVVRNDGVAAGWVTAGEAAPTGPLIDYVNLFSQPGNSTSQPFGPYSLQVRAAPTPAQ